MVRSHNLDGTRAVIRLDIADAFMYAACDRFMWPIYHSGRTQINLKGL